MRITIVCGHFIPAMGYIEVHLAKTFASLGHKVSVVTSDAIPPYVSHLHSSFGVPLKDVKVIRLKPFYSLGQIVFANGVKKAVLNTQPDRVLIIGLGKRFPKSALSLDVHTTVLLGDNQASYGSSHSFKTRLLFELFKRATYQRAIKNAHKLVAYTPESFEAAGAMLGRKWLKALKSHDDFISLGYHPEEFFFDPHLRSEKRHALGYTDEDHVVITATRIRPEKNIESAIAAFINAPKNVKWLLIGSSEDHYAETLTARLEASITTDRFMLMPHQDRTDLNAFYNAADTAIFTTPAISIIEAMGAGLPVIIPNTKSLSHLLTMPLQGSYVPDWNNKKFEKVSLKKRQELNLMNKETLSWKRQAELLLK